MAFDTEAETLFEALKVTLETFLRYGVSIRDVSSAAEAGVYQLLRRSKDLLHPAVE
jgi:hypothetical protein